MCHARLGDGPALCHSRHFHLDGPEASAHTPLPFEAHLHQAPVLGRLPCSHPHQHRAEAGEAALLVRGGCQVLPRIHRRPPCTQPGKAGLEPAQVAESCTNRGQVLSCLHSCPPCTQPAGQAAITQHSGCKYGAHPAWMGDPPPASKGPPAGSRGLAPEHAMCQARCQAGSGSLPTTVKGSGQCAAEVKLPFFLADQVGSSPATSMSCWRCTAVFVSVVC